MLRDFIYLFYLCFSDLVFYFFWLLTLLGLSGVKEDVRDWCNSVAPFFAELRFHAVEF